MTGLFVLQLLVVYGLIQLLVSDGFVPVTELDYAIPTVPSFLAAYCLYYLILPLPFWSAYQQRSTQKSLFAVGATFFVAATICNTIFILFPTEIIRPTVNGTGFFAESLRFLHAVDGSVALLPSGHVTYSLVAALTTMHMDRKLGIIIWLVAFLVMPATVLIKQHYILDVLGGILVALFSYYIVFRPLWSQRNT
jgi:membrane-associated phospholipid phosphatase